MPLIQDEEKYREQEAGRKLRQARRNQFIEFVVILALAILVVALALSALYR